MAILRDAELLTVETAVMVQASMRVVAAFMLCSGLRSIFECGSFHETLSRPILQI